MTALRFSFGFFLSFLTLLSFSQSRLAGNIFDKKSREPLADVSVSVKKKRVGSLSDQKGRFVLSGSNLKKTDTLEISSIGYSTLRIPLSEAFLTNEFFLTADPKSLAEVKAYSNHHADGSVSEVNGYFCSWSTRKNGGEIGRIIQTKANDFKVDRVRFKINNQCDTCIVRLHMRNVVYGKPGEDLLRDSITMEISRKAFDDKSVEFDLANRNIIIKNNNALYIGLETIHCNSAKSNGCSLAYIGTEEGSYIYKTKGNLDWETSYTNSLYIKLFYTY